MRKPELFLINKNTETGLFGLIIPKIGSVRKGSLKHLSVLLKEDVRCISLASVLRILNFIYFFLKLKAVHSRQNIKILSERVAQGGGFLLFKVSFRPLSFTCTAKFSFYWSQLSKVIIFISSLLIIPKAAAFPSPT